jgi:hypothetical protein
MIDPKYFSELMEKLTNTLTEINDVMNKHNLMILDIYERIAKLEEIVGKEL